MRGWLNGNRGDCPMKWTRKEAKEQFITAVWTALGAAIFGGMVLAWLLSI